MNSLVGGADPPRLHDRNGRGVACRLEAPRDDGLLGVQLRLVPVSAFSLHEGVHDKSGGLAQAHGGKPILVRVRVCVSLFFFFACRDSYALAPRS